MLKRSSLKHSQSAVLWEHHNEEVKRLVEDKNRQANWREWGPYLSDRQWGTVREDYSHDGNCWDYFPHDHARSRAYRWGEDGLFGIADSECRLCFSMALWNEKDAILKERLFGLNGHEGNHGEDVKECYYYLDGAPTHSYMKALYKYPQNEFPYERLVQVNRERNTKEPEFELIDTGVFEEGRYWDVTVEYAKDTPNKILISITVANRGPDHARVHLLPTLWFRNTWSWDCRQDETPDNKPVLWEKSPGTLVSEHHTLGKYVLDYEADQHRKFPEVLFTENETNSERLFNVPSYTKYQKDAFHRYVINEETQAINPAKRGTKAAVYYVLMVPPGGHYTVRLRLSSEAEHVINTNPFAEKVFGGIVETRRKECDKFYKAIIPGNLSAEEHNVCRQAYASLVWNKQFYHYVVKDWLLGDQGTPSPPSSRLSGRNSSGWQHLYCRDIVSTADKWEYPYFASWNLAFHLILFAKIDPEFAKNQLLLLLSDRYMSPEGQIPAYEFELSDVSPPVYALVTWRVYTLSERHGHRDDEFLARCFRQLNKNFNWCRNRRDPKGKEIFCGGLDNIATFDSSENVVQQAVDGPAWMAAYSVTMLHIALQLALADPVYEDVACKFLDTFIDLADVMTNMSDGLGFWDSTDGFYYDHLKYSDGTTSQLRVRSMVGLVPLIACFLVDDEYIEKLTTFRKRLRWFVENRTDLPSKITFMDPDSESKYHHLLAIPTVDHLKTILVHMLNEDEFLSPFGIRSVSKYHKDNPYVAHINSQEHRVEYVPSECTTQAYRGNSNWRGPVWFTLNFAIIEALDRYGLFYGDKLKVEYPTGSRQFLRLREVSQEISRLISQLFLPNEKGLRPCHGEEARYAHDFLWNRLVLFYEYFDPDTGRGCGASHFTGGTALVAKLLDKVAAKLK